MCEKLNWDTLYTADSRSGGQFEGICAEERGVDQRVKEGKVGGEHSHPRIVSQWTMRAQKLGGEDLVERESRGAGGRFWTNSEKLPRRWRARATCARSRHSWHGRSVRGAGWPSRSRACTWHPACCGARADTQPTRAARSRWACPWSMFIFMFSMFSCDRFSLPSTEIVFFA